MTEPRKTKRTPETPEELFAKDIVDELNGVAEGIKTNMLLKLKKYGLSRFTEEKQEFKLMQTYFDSQRKMDRLQYMFASGYQPDMKDIQEEFADLAGYVMTALIQIYRIQNLED